MILLSTLNVQVMRFPTDIIPSVNVGRRNMLPYQEDGKKLEELLERLFEDGDELTSEDIVVLNGPGPPKPNGPDCCVYNYGSN